MNTNLNIYKDKKIFITGITGFKGSWLGLWLKKLGGQVYGLGLHPVSYPSHFSLLNCLDLKDFNYDIRNKESLKFLIDHIKPDIIFHLAAQPFVIKAYKNPEETYNININGTINLLECLRTTFNPSALVVITTDKVYKDQLFEYSYKETDILEGYDPYACSKVCVEHIVQSYKKSFLKNILIATARAGNVIGGGDFGENRLIPGLIKAYKNKNQMILRNPNHIRPWQHVLDCLFGYILLGKNLLEGKSAFEGAWNFGPPTENCITVQEIIQLCKNSFSDLESCISIANTDFDNSKTDFHETKILMLDSTKAQNKLGWKPKYAIENAVKKTMEWYKAYFNKNIITNQQVEEYEKI